MFISYCTVHGYKDLNLPSIPLTYRYSILHECCRYRTGGCSTYIKASYVTAIPTGFQSLKQGYMDSIQKIWGLLDRSTALYFYKRLKTSLHKPRGNLFENLFFFKCAFKNNFQLLEKKFLSQTNTTPKNGILLGKMAHF